MSTNPEPDGIVTLRPRPDGLDTEQAQPLAAEGLPPVGHTPLEAAVGPQPGAANDVVAASSAAITEQVPVRARTRPGWLAPAAIAAAGVIASGTLGYLLYTTSSERDGAQHQVATTQASLASTQQQLAAAQSDAATRKVTADYVRLYIADAGKVQTDYENTVNCTDFSTCRTAAQQMLADMQAFQADRQSAGVPASLASSDSMLGDALSAGIAGDQELVSGMDSGSDSKIKDGGHKVDLAMLSMDKAESALGGALPR
jgi:hypothetical protein